MFKTKQEPFVANNALHCFVSFVIKFLFIFKSITANWVVEDFTALQLPFHFV